MVAVVLVHRVRPPAVLAAMLIGLTAVHAANKTTIPPEVTQAVAVHMDATKAVRVKAALGGAAAEAAEAAIAAPAAVVVIHLAGPAGPAAAAPAGAVHPPAMVPVVPVLQAIISTPAAGAAVALVGLTLDGVAAAVLAVGHLTKRVTVAPATRGTPAIRLIQLRLTGCL